MTPPAAGETAPAPGLGPLIRCFLIIGCLGFGGPAGQIGLMHRMIVDDRRWVDDRRFLNALNLCMLLPGPEAQQLATWIGWHVRGPIGGVIAGLLFILPGFLLITALALTYAIYGNEPLFAVLFLGLKAAALALVVEALFRVAKKALKDRFAYALAAAAFLGIFLFAVPFPLLIIAALVIGYFRNSVATKPQAPRPRLTLTDFKPAIVATLLWFALPLALLALLGPSSLYADLARFFATTAVVTFGGAYAILSHVADAAVETHRWLSPADMVNGLALAETTPGPLILVLVFVGSLAAYRQPLPLDPVTGGLVGAALTAFVTFAPSFAFIFAGAPLLERLLNMPRLSSALSAVTAVVVGVILNLTLWLASHLLFTRQIEVSTGPLKTSLPDLTSHDPLMLALSAAALMLVLKVKAPLWLTLTLALAAGPVAVYGFGL